MLPNFIIVGAMKAGTTTLHDYLAGIEDVWIAPGEIRYFSNERNYARGLEWYERLFDPGAGKLAIGEKSPAYSYLPKVPERIHRCLPGVKLIWIFRDPVARTYSHYWHAATRGKERLTFASAIARERERVRSNILLGYMKRSLYAEQVERYLGFFPREQMLFLLFEDLVREPAAVVNRVLDFLCVPHVLEAPRVARHSNVTRAPRLVSLQWVTRTLLRRHHIAQLVQRVNRRAEPGYPRLSSEMRDQLAREFQEPNRALARLTGLDLGAWNQPGAPQS